jgi:hypothetical protein
MLRVDWRLSVELTLAAVWWTLTPIRGCDGGKPRPLELVPAEQQQPYTRALTDALRAPWTLSAPPPAPRPKPWTEPGWTWPRAPKPNCS